METLNCPICRCGQRSFHSEAKLVNHIVTFHRDKQRSIIYECFTCSARFTSYSALKVHHWRKHQQSIGVQEQHLEAEAERFDDTEDETQKDFVEELVISKAGSAPKLEDELLFHAASLLIKIREKLNATQTVVDAVIVGVDKLVDIFLSIIQNQFISKGANHIYSIDEVLSTIQLLRGNSIFEGVQSQDLLKQYLLKENSIVPPEKIVTLKRNVVMGNRIKEVDVDYGYIVPFLPMLEQVLSCPEVLECVDNPKLVEDGVFTSPLDGYVYKNHPTVLKDPKTLAISLYQDDAGTTDVVSSKASENNVRYIYWTLLNIHPELRSSTQSINLLCCVKTKVIKKHGYEAFIRDFVHSINKLSSAGIRLKVGAEHRLFHAIFLFASGDNPASSSFGGFKEGFFADVPCRQCPTLKVHLFECHKEEDIPLRSKKSHEEQVTEIESFRAEARPANQRDPSVKYGINERSVLMDIEGCDVTKCLPQDLMHDVIEGTLHLEMCLLLQHVLEKKTISIGQINLRIAQFSKYFKVNKPSPLDTKRIQEKSLRATAAELLNLAYMLPFVLRKKNFMTREMESVCVQANLKCYILRLRIVNALMADQYVISDVSRLRSMMEAHHKLFMELYENKILKFHTELHFGTAILLYGPPRQQWCFRFEAKHAFFKRLCRISRAFKNLTMSLSTRHQMRQGGMMMLSAKGEDGPFLKGPTSFGMAFSKPLNDVNKHQELLVNVFSKIPQNAVVKKYNVVCLNGVNLRRKSVFVLPSGGNLPVFGEIVAMYAFGTELALVYKQLVTSRYDSSCNAFLVEYGATTGIILAANLLYHHQLFVIRSVGSNYVIMPCKSHD